MATLCLDNTLTPYTNNQSQHIIENGSLGRVLQDFFNKYPALYVRLFDCNSNNGTTCYFILNDEILLETTDLTTCSIHEYDSIYLLNNTPTGEAGAVGAAVINAIAGAGTTTAAAIGAQIVGTVILMGVMMALNFVIGALVGGMSSPNIYSGSLDNSASYTFTGIKNTTAGGTPIQIVYGTHRTGGQVLSLFTSSVDTDTTISDTRISITTDTYLYYLLGISEGVIEGVSNIEVNKLPSSFYSAVETSMRYGTSNQDIIPDYNQIFTTTTISRKVTKLSQDLTATPATYSQYTPVYGLMAARGYSLGSSDLKLGMYQIDVTYVDETAGG